MKPVDRQKICSNCDGRIPMNAKECIYCGAELPEEVQTPLFKQQTLQESLTSLYSPPYSSRNQTLFQSEEEPASRSPSTPPSQSATAAASQEESEADIKSSFLPILLLVVGSNLFTVGLLQFFFSSNGLLALEWDSSFWFLYCLTALPLCYFGYKKA